jgi:hypothetical protein
MNPHLIKRLFPHASKSLLELNAKDYGPSTPDLPQSTRKAAQPEQAPERKGLQLAHGSKTEETGPKRVHLRITSVRKRICDPDNLVPKWHIDCLRYCGIIRDDTAQEISLEVAQRKAQKGEEEHTLIELLA